MLLVLETARVEVAVLLNELAYSKYEASKSSATDDPFILKQRNLAITFSLIEKIIKLISHFSEVEGTHSFNCIVCIMPVISVFKLFSKK